MLQRPSGAPRRRALPRRGLAALAMVAVLAGACVDRPPATDSPSGDPSGSDAPTASDDLPALELPLPNGDTDTSQVLLDNADGVFDLYRSVGRLAGASLACTLVLIDAAPGVTTGPAYALTSGRCLGISGNDTLTDQPQSGMTAVFDAFADTPEHLVVPVVAAAYASLKRTDLAILRLDTTVGALADAGYRPWPITDVATQDGSSRDVIMVGAPIGAALRARPDAEQALRLGTCSLDTDPALVNERLWLWSALRTDCPEVLPGNAGSPVFDIGTASLIGLVSTTTYKGEAGGPCALGRPCEVTDEGEDALPDTTYAMPLGILGGCFGADGVFALGPTCGLDPGDGVSLAGVPVAVNPAAPDPTAGAGSTRTTWATTVEGAGFAAYRYKIQPLESGNCADEAGYGDPRPIGTPIDDALPTTEQRLLLCVVGGPSTTPDATWQPFSHATFAVAYIDTTPPTAAITFTRRGSASAGWSIEPVLAPPELAQFLQKVGPAGSTRCADRSGYVPSRGQPLQIAPGGPYHFCVIGFDDANNPSAPVGVVLR